jgi:hypothetical protein
VLDPGATVCELGEADNPKSAAGAFTTSVTLVECVGVPLESVPVIVTV